MFKPQDINLKELKFTKFESPYTWTTGDDVKEFLADKLNKFEREIDEANFFDYFLDASANPILAKRIITREFKPFLKQLIKKVFG